MHNMSLKKISELTGVSISTVSRVLNNVPGSTASDEVRARIWQAANDIGYTPNRSAQQLRRGEAAARTRRIAIVAARLHSLEADPFFHELYMNVQSELFRAGCITLRVDAHDPASLTVPECDGMVILGRCSHSLLEALKKACPNLVGIWRNPTDFDIDEVMCDGKKAAMFLFHLEWFCGSIFTTE